MKKLLLGLTLIIVLVGVKAYTRYVSENVKVSTVETINKTAYDRGWDDGHCEGWKDVKGREAYCPYPPYAPVPVFPRSADSYRDGYNDGFKQGVIDARK